MKHWLALGTLLLSPLIFANDLTVENATSEFSMPTEQQQAAKQYSLDELKQEQLKLNRALGAYPASFFMADHKQQTYQTWTDLLINAAQLQPDNKQQASDKIYLLAELFRNGHNMGIEGATEEADKAISTCLHYEPDSRRCQLSSIMFYMSVNERFFPEVEQQLQQLKASYGELANADVEIAYAYYYVYTQQTELAIKQIDYVISEFDELKKDSVKKFRLKQLHEFKIAMQQQKKKQTNKQ